jgi:hypothetical protein
VQPDEVTLEFSVTPQDAIVTVDGRPVESGKLTLPAGTTPVAVRIEAPGYEPYEAEVVPQRSKGIVVPLVKITEPEPGGRPGRRGDRTGDGRRRPPKNDDEIITDDPYK